MRPIRRIRSPGLTGNTFGVDFNLVADRLRIVSDAGQSLRINVDTGFVTTDTNLNPGTPLIVAAAYKGSFPVTTATQLRGRRSRERLPAAAEPAERWRAHADRLLRSDAHVRDRRGLRHRAAVTTGCSLGALQPKGSAQSTPYNA